MFNMFRQLEIDWFVMLRYGGYWDNGNIKIDILEPQEILDYVKDNSKEKLIKDLEKIVKLRKYMER